MDKIQTLLDFLQIPLGDSNAVLKKFASLPGAIRRGQGASQFVFIKGTRQDRVLLLAHADTVWDSMDPYIIQKPDLYINKGIVTNKSGGLGADDRAGCAIVWALRDMGHSILITNGEEYGGVGSDWLMDCNPDIRDEINTNCSFAVELDRCNDKDFKCYSVGTDAFREYIIKETGYSEPNRNSFTDIVTICEHICGVNLSVGYYNEHTDNEYLDIDAWENTLRICRKWLKKKLPKFELTEEAYDEQV